MTGLYLQGMEQVNKTLLELASVGDPDVIEPILLEGAETIADAARANAPRGPTGNLKRGIIAKTLKRKLDKPAPSIAAINYKVAPHAHLVEFGHGGRKAGPHPFLRPAWDGNRVRVEQEIADKIRRAIEGTC